MVKRCEELLTHAGVKRVYLVFDGERCPLKAVTNQEREEKRRKNLAEARRLTKLGKRDEALDKYKACIKVVPWMAESVAKAVAQKWKRGFAEAQVVCVFSPYEADAQLAKLCVDGLADAVVTEDSDVLVYSAACNCSFPIIYKLDRDRGHCDVISMDWLLSSSTLSSSLPLRPSDDDFGFSSIRRLLTPREIAGETKKSGASKTKKAAGGALLSHLLAMTSREARNGGSGARMFVQACVLAGCDYAPSQLAGVGLVGAFKIIKENAHREPDCRFLHALKSIPKEKILAGDDDLDHATSGLKREDVSAVAHEYEELLVKSECVFYFHRVLDKNGKVVPLVELKNGASLLGQDNKENKVTDFLPCTKRFGGDSFVGDLNICRTNNFVSTTMPNKAPKVQSSAPSVKAFMRNPYGKKEAVPKKTQPVSKIPTKRNIFSYYAHDSAVKTSKEATLPASSSLKSTGMRDGGIDLPPPHGECITLDDDDDSDEEIEDAAPSRTQGQASNRENRSQSISSSSSLSSMSYAEEDCISKNSKSVQSKFFFEGKASTRKPTDILAISTPVEEEPNAIRMVTPTMADLNKKIDPTMSCLDDSSDDDLVLPISRDSKAVRPNISSHEDSSDDDDCIIIEDSVIVQTQNIATTKSTITPQSQSPYTARSSTFGSTFAKAQREGTRARLSSPKFARKKKRSNTKKALGTSTKRAKTASIKGFFAPLATRDD